MVKSDSNMENLSWSGEKEWLKSGARSIKEAIAKVDQPVYLVKYNNTLAVANKGYPAPAELVEARGVNLPLCAWVPPVLPENLGAEDFKRRHNLKYAYLMGAMAHGISSVRMLKAAGKAGMLGFFGSGGLDVDAVDSAIKELQQEENLPFGFNLIHSPGDQQLEQAVVELYLRRRVRLISASAFMGMTLPLVQYRLAGIDQDADGSPVCKNRIIAKVSREELAEKFLSPPAPDMVAALRDMGLISARQAELASRIPMADDLTAEADSGGHTDNRPALAMLPTFIAIRDRLNQKFGFEHPPTVGLAGGIASPQAVAAAFGMGAAYVLTGSINQGCVEAATSTAVKQMLAEARQADIAMAPAGDMFELGVKVQVLKRGTMFAMRAARLYDLYCRYDSLESIPPKERLFVERQLLRRSFQEAWQDTKAFFVKRDPDQIKLAEKDPKHQMALVFRSYLGLASIWAREGVEDRVIDYQIWCGPAMGAFNQWANGSFLEFAENRRCVEVGLNLLYAAARLMRAVGLANQGIKLPREIFEVHPLPLEQIPLTI